MQPNGFIDLGSISLYLELSRMHKPIALLYTYFPYLFGNLLFCNALQISGCSIRLEDLLKVNLMLLCKSVALRGWGCVWNDICDRDIDAQVARTRERPLPRGALSVEQAAAFAIALFVMEISVSMVLLPSMIWLFPQTLLAILYPFAKRFMLHPQLFLGMTFSAGVFLSKPIFGDSDSIPSNVYLGLTAMFLASTLWTVFYDTIYALQDVNDDIKAGVKSAAVTHLSHIKPFLLLITGIQFLLLISIGVCLTLPALYYVGTCLGTLIMQSLIVNWLDVKDPKNCLWWFTHGSYMIASTISSGFIACYIKASQ